MSDVSFSKTVNDFVEKIKQNNHTIDVKTIGRETIIIYEDYEHEPITNCNSGFKKGKRKKFN